MSMWHFGRHNLFSHGQVRWSHSIRGDARTATGQGSDMYEERKDSLLDLTELESQRISTAGLNRV